MENRDISILMMKNTTSLDNLIKLVHEERLQDDRIHGDEVLTDRQFVVLASVNRHKKIELKNLSKDLYVSTSSLCILLNKLVDHGYVYREEDSKDRRNTFYCITEKGNDIVKKEVEKFITIISLKLDILNHDQKTRLLTSLKEVESLVKMLF